MDTERKPLAIHFITKIGCSYNMCRSLLFILFAYHLASSLLAHFRLDFCYFVSLLFNIFRKFKRGVRIGVNNIDSERKEEFITRIFKYLNIKRLHFKLEKKMFPIHD